MMKKLMILMLVLIAVPAMANVTLTASQVEDTNEVEIGYIADANVSGFALKVTATDGVIYDVTGYHVGESNSTAKGYGIFPGTIDINDAGEVLDNGSPVADPCDPGTTGTGLDSNTVILELGALYVDGNEPPQTGTLCSVWVTDTTTQLCVNDDTPLRGGVVYTDATQATVDSNCTDVSFGGVCVGNVNGDDKVSPDDITSLVLLLQDNKVLVTDPILPDYYVYEILPADSAWLDEADVNGDGKITPDDITSLVLLLQDNKVLVTDPILPDYYVYEIDCN
jgi:hypothetical protein